MLFISYLFTQVFANSIVASLRNYLNGFTSWVRVTLGNTAWLVATHICWEREINGFVNPITVFARPFVS
jgi:hypothetical protein